MNILLAATDGNTDATAASRGGLEKGMTEQEKGAGQKLAQHWFVTLEKNSRLVQPHNDILAS